MMQRLFALAAMVLLAGPASAAHAPTGNANVDAAMAICDANAPATGPWPAPWTSCNAILAKWQALSASTAAPPGPMVQTPQQAFVASIAAQP